jgi:two-component system sensor histidine kinase HydH
MTEKRQTLWLRLVRLGAPAMAVLAAVAVAFTALFARHALDAAADVVVRGDADTLMSTVVVDLWRSDDITPGALDALLARHRAQHLQYVALLSRDDGHVLFEAGAATLHTGRTPYPDIVRRGARVRASRLIPPRAETDAVLGGGPPDGPALLQPYPRPRLVIEMDPPVIGQLERAIESILVVTGVAFVALVVFAWAWSRTLGRLMQLQVRAEGERRLVELGRASSVMAHELRNPLTALKGHAQLLLEDVPESLRPKVGRVVDGAERLERLSNVLLDFVREAPLQIDAVKPADLVHGAIAPLRSERVTVDVARAPPELRLDRERAELALRNLVSNALQASDGPVEVTVLGAARQVVVEVRDHGPGVPADVAATIFGPFVTTKTQGTGLGLAVARRIAEQHGGTLTGANHAHGGAVFRIALPREPHRTKS